MLQFHKTETTTLVATSESTWKTGYLYTINRLEDTTHQYKNKPYWNVTLQSVRADKAVQHRFVKVFMRLQDAKAFCQWLDQGYSLGFLKYDNTIPTFRNGGSTNEEKA